METMTDKLCEKLNHFADQVRLTRSPNRDQYNVYYKMDGAWFFTTVNGLALSCSGLDSILEHVLVKGMPVPQGHVPPTDIAVGAAT